MTGIYLTDMLNVLRAAGVTVAESSTTNGWQRRARSSGGFPAMPTAVQWHHTASQTAPANDLNYMINGNSDAPVGNCLLDRTGTFWPIAAGAANTAGKGGSLTVSRATIPQDGANARTFAIEAANNGVGEAWPQVQIDAFFAISNALNAWFGNLPTDVFNHNTWAPTRKIDPATSAAVQGPWRPGSSTSSGTWRQADVNAECSNRAAAPGPQPIPDLEEDDMLHVIAYADDGTTVVRGPAIVGPGYWHFSRSADEAYLFCKVWGDPRRLDNAWDFDQLMKSAALEPDDATSLGST